MAQTDETAQGLLQAAVSLRDQYAGGAPISTSRLLNPLLDLWSVASELGPDVSRPIEQLLTVYAGPRDLAMPSELGELVDAIEQELDKPAMV